jgi:hypothetical protein
MLGLYLFPLEKEVVMFDASEHNAEKRQKKRNSFDARIAVGFS